MSSKRTFQTLQPQSLKPFEQDYINHKLSQHIKDRGIVNQRLVQVIPETTPLKRIYQYILTCFYFHQTLQVCSYKQHQRKDVNDVAQNAYDKLEGLKLTFGKQQHSFVRRNSMPFMAQEHTAKYYSYQSVVEAFFKQDQEDKLERIIVEAASKKNRQETRLDFRYIELDRHKDKQHYLKSQRKIMRSKGGKPNNLIGIIKSQNRYIIVVYYLTEKGNENQILFHNTSRSKVQERQQDDSEDIMLENLKQRQQDSEEEKQETRQQVLQEETHHKTKNRTSKSSHHHSKHKRERQQSSRTIPQSDQQRFSRDEQYKRPMIIGEQINDWFVFLIAIIIALLVMMELSQQAVPLLEQFPFRIAQSLIQYPRRVHEQTIQYL